MEIQYETPPQIEAMLVVRGLDDSTLEQLRATAAHHGRSVEAEVRQILEVHVSQLRDASGSRIRGAQAAAGALGRRTSERCETLSPMKQGLQMLLEMSAQAERK
jgi:plasmid stability protein